MAFLLVKVFVYLECLNTEELINPPISIKVPGLQNAAIIQVK